MANSPNFRLFTIKFTRKNISNIAASLHIPIPIPIPIEGPWMKAAAWVIPELVTAPHFGRTIAEVDDGCCDWIALSLVSCS